MEQDRAIEEDDGVKSLRIGVQSASSFSLFSSAPAARCDARVAARRNIY